MATAYGLQKTATSMASIAWRLGELETLLGDE
jgi:hypothetical protein